MGRLDGGMQRDDFVGLSTLGALMVSVFALGGVPRWAIGVTAVLLAVALAALWRARRYISLSPLFLLLLTAVGLTLLQAIPLPEAVAEALSPTQTDLIRDARALAGGSSWYTITGDQPGTWRALLQLLVLTATAGVSLRLAVSERGRYRILVAVALVGGAAAVVTALHVVLDAESLYGFYRPRWAHPVALGPILNTNSLGALFAATAALTLGLAAYRNQSTRARGAWIVLALFAVAMTLLTRSRGAAVALATGAVTTFLVLFMQRLRRKEHSMPALRLDWRTSVPAAISVLCVLVLVVQLMGGRVAGELERTNLEGELTTGTGKVAAWRAARQLVEEAPILGVGRGAFEPAFTRVFPPGSHGTFAYVENEYVQALVDWGIAGTLALGIGLAWTLLVMARRLRAGPLAAGALGALGAIAVQSTVDFGLELLGLAMPVVMIASTLTYAPLKERTERRRLVLAGRTALLAALALGVVLVVPPWGRTVSDDHEALAESSGLAPALAAMRRHPLDYLAAAHAAQAAAKVGDPRTMSLINHGLSLNPSHAGLHWLAARMLVRANNSPQAAIEYRLALAGSRDLGALVAELSRIFPSDEAALRALPERFWNPGALDLALHRNGRPSLAVAYLRREISLTGRSRAIPELLYAAAGRQRDQDARILAARHLADDRATARDRLVLAEELRRAQRHKDILDLLARPGALAGTPEEQVKIRTLLCETLVSLGDSKQAETCLQDLLRDLPLDAVTDMEIRSRLPTLVPQAPP